MSWISRNSAGPSCARALLGLQHPPEPVFARLLRVRAGDGPVVEELDLAVHAPEVAPVAVGLVQLVAQLEERRHPDLLLVVLDHRLHRPVLVDDRADPAAEPAGAAARRRAIDDQRALAPLGRPLVHAQERLVVVAPGVLHLHEVEPDVVVVPVLDGRVDERVGQAGVGDEPLADAPGCVLLDGGGPSLALGLARAEDEDGLAVLLHDLADELVGRLDLEPLGAPAELLARGRVAAADQVDPERVRDLRRELVRVDRHLLLAGRVPHPVERGLDPRATSGCSTSVSVEMTWIGFVRSAAGSLRMASQTSCSVALESLPPL